MSTTIRLSGELAPWPTRDALAELLRAAGLPVTVGHHSVRLGGCSHFVFQDFGSTDGDPTIDADGPDLATLTKEATRVSAALAEADVRHRFELYDEADLLVAYLHHGWPSAKPA
jgi:hypothetical protein